ncbi:MAG TPA: class I SAM-dependent methyltransferase [Gammaproteobacteria bacterium]|nr:class I SAM-dependent methyltransferase [Gammaproteobacteria bacterium]
MNYPSPQYYENRQRRALRSAQAAVPVLVKLFEPQSVLDVGCGTGEWLAALREGGINDLCGIEHAPAFSANLAVPRGLLTTLDLSDPFRLQREFDLVLCLEVAQFLPRESASTLVESLVRHAKTVIFSAAVPGQGGEGNSNPQWPSYWAELFSRAGYVAEDSLRPLLWLKADIAWWYRQNIIVYRASSQPMRAGRGGDTKIWPLPLIHPGWFGHEPS